MNPVWYVVTDKAVLVYYRERGAAEEAQCMAENLARGLGKLALIYRCKSRPYYSEKTRKVVPAVLA